VGTVGWVVSVGVRGGELFARRRFPSFCTERLIRGGPFVFHFVELLPECGLCMRVDDEEEEEERGIAEV
jgi:hypothetical protein